MKNRVRDPLQDTEKLLMTTPLRSWFRTIYRTATVREPSRNVFFSSLLQDTRLHREKLLELGKVLQGRKLRILGEFLPLFEAFLDGFPDVH